MAVGDEWEQSKLNPLLNRSKSMQQQQQQQLEVINTAPAGTSDGPTTNKVISFFEKIFNQGVKESTQPIWERDSTVEIVGPDGADKIKDTVLYVPEKIKEGIEQGVKESTQPIWERDSTVEIVGPDGADKIKKTLDPTEWVDIPDIIPDIVPDEAKDTIKKYLPVVALGAGALFLLSALK